MGLKDEVMEVKKEFEKVKETGAIPSASDGAIATEVVKLLKTSVKRMYILVIILLLFLIGSILDSIYQRNQIIDILEDFEIVEETVVEEIIEEDYDITQESGDGGNNNFINGNSNEVNN